MGSESDDGPVEYSGGGSSRGGVADSIADTIAGLRGVLDRQSNGEADDAVVGTVDGDEGSSDEGSDDEREVVLSDLYEPTVDDELADHPTRRAVLADAKQSFADSSMAGFAGVPTEEAVETRLFDFSYLHDHEEVDRYWVNEPFAYVSVLDDVESDDRRYRVTEPILDEYEEYVLDELTKVLRNNLMYHDVGEGEDKAETFTRRAGELVAAHTAAIEPLSVHKILYYLRRDFLDYERIDPILRDGKVEDISCDGTDVPVFVYHKEYRDLDTNVAFGSQELSSFVTRMAQRSGKHLSVANPLVDGSLPDGSRVQLTFGGEIATRGPNFTIRQFSSVPDTPIDLINWETFSLDQMAYLWLAIENNRSLLFAGGTGAGKTTSLNAVSFFIPKKSKVVSIEDTREISLPHQNWVQSVTRESSTSGGRGEVTMYQQLQAALRQRPEYILVGEIRTESRVALTFFQAMATGHAAYSTFHSESVKGVINRIENQPLNVPTQMLKELDIISIQRQVMLGDQRVRRNDSITELLSRGEGDDISINEVFDWDPKTDSYNETFESEVLQDIADDRGWNTKQLNREFERRKEVLGYLLDNDITWHEDVARTIHTFIADQERVLSGIRSDELDPSELEVG
jgi:flagellar protein FlaI